MTMFLLAIVFLALGLIGVVIRKSYYAVPITELKRQAVHHDPTAERLYKVLAYGSSLRALLWGYIALTTGLGIILLAQIAPWWLSLIVVIGLFWIVYSWLPASKVSGVGARLSLWAATPIVWILSRLYPAIDKLASVAEKRYTAPFHTGMYERSDLLKLIQKQRTQPDNRVSDEELEIINRALTFHDRSVGSVMASRKDFTVVKAEDTLGPVVIDELHKSGQPFALVKDGAKGPIIGSVNIEQLGIKSSGLVRDHMDDTVYYLHEQDSLSEALHAVLVTNHPLFIVVNSHEEFVGIVSLQTIVHELLGHIPGDDFDQYSNIAGIAARHTPAPKELNHISEADEFSAEVVK